PAPTRCADRASPAPAWADNPTGPRPPARGKRRTASASELELLAFPSAVVEGRDLGTGAAGVAAAGDEDVARLYQLVGPDLRVHGVRVRVRKLEQVAARVTGKHLHRAVAQPAHLAPRRRVDRPELLQPAERLGEIGHLQADVAAERGRILPFRDVKLL